MEKFEAVMLWIGWLPRPLLRVRFGVYSKVSSQEPADPPQDVSSEFVGGD